MVSKTPTPSHYTRIKQRPEAHRAPRQKGHDWAKFFFAAGVTPFLYTNHTQHSSKPTKIGKSSIAYLMDLRFDSILRKHINTLSETPDKIAAFLPSIVKKRIQDLEQLEVDWDSYAARPISHEAIQRVKSLLIRISLDFGLQLVRDAFIAPCPDGGIQLEWELNSKELIIKIAPDGSELSFLLVTPSGEEEEGSNISKVRLHDLLQEILNP